VPYLLDTSVLVDLLRGRPVAERVTALLAANDVPYVCAVNADEVMRGVRPEEAGRAAEAFLHFRVVPLGVNEGALAGTWRREFARRGVTLHQTDCLVAAAAVAAHAVLATGNPKNFPMEGLTVEHWPVGT
jgi:hypothetical protein